MKNKSVCIHLHFDLPPRDNPWLEEPETGAALPYRDEAERLFHLCWGPLSAAALPSREGRFRGIRDAFQRLSFDLSPALLDWLERRQPAAYRRILEADRASRERNAGHGAALAHPYPGLILPLASEADKRTALRWGLRDFEARFRRRAEGIWLSENAVDEETMEVAAECGIRFTLLAAHQAARVRPTGSKEDGDWLEVAPETLSLSRPYRWRSRRRPDSWVDVFFYRTDIAAGRILGDLPASAASMEDIRSRAAQAGQRLANKLVDSLTANDARELSHTALDGDWFGHWRPNAEQALAYALETVDTEPPAELSCYARFLDLVPPPQEVELHRLSSRSCPHGVGRWSTDCGCPSGMGPRAPERGDPPLGEGTAQPFSSRQVPPDDAGLERGGEKAKWRKPLREALDWLAAELDGRFELLGSGLFRSPAQAREDYGSLAFDPRPESADPFLEAQTLRHPTPAEARKALRLAEMQRRRLLMFEHWSWEARDVSEGSALQALAEAAKALELLGSAEGDASRAEALRETFISKLAACRSEGTAYPNAAEAFRRLVLPMRVSLEHAAAHFAAADHLFHSASLEEAFLIRPGIPMRALERVLVPLCRRTRSSRERTSSISVIQVSVRRRRSCESLDAAAAVLHRGGTELEVWTAQTAPGPCARALDEAFLRGGEDAFRKEADSLMGPSEFSMDALLPAARRETAAALLSRAKSGARGLRRRWARAAAGIGRPSAAAELAALLHESREAGVPPDALPGIWMLRDHIARAAASLARRPHAPRAEELSVLLQAASETGLHLDLWELRDSVWSALGSPGTEALSPETRGALREALGLPEPSAPVLEEQW